MNIDFTQLPPPDWQDEKFGVALYCADCMDILPQLPKVDAVVTDPPYGCNATTGRGGVYDGFRLDGDNTTELRDTMIGVVDCPIIMFGSPRITRPSGEYTVLIWHKGEHTGMGDLSFPWKPDFEEIYVYGKAYSGRRTSSVLRYYMDISSSRAHPTGKPLALMTELVGKCCAQTILDPFMGSGTTGVACVNLDRQFIGIEKEPKYFDIAVNRIREAIIKKQNGPLFAEHAPAQATMFSKE